MLYLVVSRETFSDTHTQKKNAEFSDGVVICQGAVLGRLICDLL